MNPLDKNLAVFTTLSDEVTNVSSAFVEKQINVLSRTLKQPPAQVASIVVSALSRVLAGTMAMATFTQEDVVAEKFFSELCESIKAASKTTRDGLKPKKQEIQ